MQNLFCSNRKRRYNIDEHGNGSVVTISYKIQFIDSARCFAVSSSNLVDNPAEGIQKNQCKDCDCFLECQNVKENSVKYKLSSYNKECLSYNNFYEELKKIFKNTLKFSGKDINKYILLSRRTVNPDECIDDWE